ncbi:hypothetical protein GCM10010954_26500 [Halobacillus andaensis]|uniref:Uncharacterized protein n=1 Tax=Halobacillus andaensis TaxID=1176239 RepID=A0A917EXE8_HALAA|nr:hypothetical protein [Halobacillus andaensis]MBP2005765.1 hypothetical protein [Halobacillus andaensis]GGF26195.1 hypothetical protein GCM10010954_26500 [Halobacillus andaensis]
MREKQVVLPLLQSYADGRTGREEVVSRVENETRISLRHMERYRRIYHLLSWFYEDVDEAELYVSRQGVIQVLSAFLSHSLSLSEIKLWVWDVSRWQMSGNEDEQNLLIEIIEMLDLTWQIAPEKLNRENLEMIVQTLVNIRNPVLGLQVIMKWM